MSQDIEQPPPTPNDNQPIWPLVVEDMTARDDLGQRRYGTRLQPFNGRNMLADAYMEALDLVVYLKGRIVEDIERRKALLLALESLDAGKTDSAREQILHALKNSPPPVADVP